MKVENKVFKLELGKSEDMKNIVLKIYEEKKNLNNKYYLLELNIQNFHNLNVLFKFYQTIDEIYSLLLDIFKKNKYSVRPKENYFILILQFSMPGNKNIYINFDLIEYKINNEDLINNLYSTVCHLLEDNKLIKEENRIIKEENKIIKEKL